MALATLINPTPVEGGTAWTVDADPFHAAPFAGPAERDWDGFRLVDDGAEFEWRSGADRVRSCAERVQVGELTVAKALMDAAVQEWLEENAAELVDLLAEDDEAGSIEDLDEDELNERVFLEFGMSVTDNGALSYYREDDDAYQRHAAEALELPPWGRVWLHDGGGPGTGFRAASIVLESGKTLEDLATWLERRGSRGSRTAKLRRSP